jgi:hypothetical protein
MNLNLVCALRASQSDIRERWRDYLGEERVNTALGNPSMLVYLFDKTLEAVFAALESPSAKIVSAAVPSDLSTVCACGKNPYLAYFRAGERALGETLTFLGTKTDEDPTGAGEELRDAIRRIALREIETFCSLCQYRAGAMKAPPAEHAPSREPESARTPAFLGFPPIARRAAPAPWRPSVPASP